MFDSPPDPPLSCTARIDLLSKAESVQEGASGFPRPSQLQYVTLQHQGLSVTVVPGMGMLSVSFVTALPVSDFRLAGYLGFIPNTCFV